jgi:hypothetical protein
MQYCTYCNEEFINVIEHCDSREHKDNVLQDSHKIKYGVEEFKKHYEVLSEDGQAMVRSYDENNSFWEVAKTLLNEEDYQTLKRGIIGRDKNDKPIRNIGRRRFSRTI